MPYIFWIVAAIISLAAFLYIFLPIKNQAKIAPMKGILPIILISVVALSGLSLFIYQQIGNQKYIAAKKAPKPSSINTVQDIIAKFEDHLEKNPKDIQAWELIAPTYMDLGQYKKAFNAYAQAIKHGASTGENWLGLGQADLLANNGAFGPMSKVAFGKAVEKMPEDALSMYFYAATLHDAGDSDEAKAQIDGFLAKTKLPEEQLKPLHDILQNIEAKKND